MEGETLDSYQVYNIFAFLEDSLKDVKTKGGLFFHSAEQACLKTAKTAFIPIICLNSLIP